MRQLTKQRRAQGHSRWPGPSKRPKVAYYIILNYIVDAHRLRLLIGVLLTMPALLTSQDKKGARAVCLMSSITEKQASVRARAGHQQNVVQVLWQHVTLTNCYELTFERNSGK